MSTEVPRAPERAVSGYSRYVQPDHSVLDDVFPPLAGDRRVDLGRALGALRSPPFTYDAFRGWISFQQLEDRLARAGGGVVALNCLTTASLLASRLRAAGYSEDQVFVVLGQTRNNPDLYECDFHAWVFVHAPDTAIWVDTAELQPRSVEALSPTNHLTPVVVFNDRRLFFGSEAKGILQRPMNPPSPRCYLYGRRDPSIAEFLAKPEWRTLLAAFLKSGDSRIPRPDIAWIEDAGAVGLCRVDADGLRPGPKLQLVRRSDFEEFRTLFQPGLKRYLEILDRSLPTLVEAFEQSPTSREFDWPDVVHLVVAGMLMDLSVGGQLRLYDRTHEQHGPTVVCGFESLPAGNAFGVRWLPGTGCDFLELWHQNLRRDALPLKPQACDLLLDVAAGRDVHGEAMLLWLRHMKLVAGRGPGIKPTFPVFLAAGSKRLLEVTKDVSAQIVEQAVTPTLAASQHAGWPGSSHDGISFAAARLVLELATDAVVEAGLLPPFPSVDEAPRNWGRWLWEQPEGSGSLREFIFSGTSPVGDAG